MSDRSTQEPDFTIECVVVIHTHHFREIVTIAGKKDDEWYVGFDPEGFLVYGFKQNANGKKKDVKLTSDFHLTLHQWHHVVIQKQNETLYFVIDGQVVKIINLNGIDIIDINKDNSSYIVGDFYSGAELPIYSTALFVTLGRSNYSLVNKEVGDSVKVTWIEPW